MLLSLKDLYNVMYKYNTIALVNRAPQAREICLGSFLLTSCLTYLTGALYDGGGRGVFEPKLCQNCQFGVPNFARMGWIWWEIEAPQAKIWRNFSQNNTIFTKKIAFV